VVPSVGGLCEIVWELFDTPTYVHIHTHTYMYIIYSQAFISPGSVQQIMLIL